MEVIISHQNLQDYFFLNMLHIFHKFLQFVDKVLIELHFLLHLELIMNFYIFIIQLNNYYLQKNSIKNAIQLNYLI